MNDFVENHVRDAVIERLLQDPDNKVRCLVRLNLAMSLFLVLLRLQEQEPEVEQLEHRHFLVLPVHE